VLGLARERRASIGLNADQPDLRPARPQRQRDTRREPAAADRDHNRLDLRKLFCELEADRALTGDHVWILEGVDERRAGFFRELTRRGERLLESDPDQLDPPTVVPRRVDFGHRRLVRHEDRRLDPGLACRPGHGLSVVARARRDDSGGPLGLAERGDSIDRASDLERARPLKVLGLEQHLAAGPARERLRFVDRSRADAGGFEPGPRSLDVSECRCGFRRQGEIPSP
jgi:hypothetical protein